MLEESSYEETQMRQSSRSRVMLPVCRDCPLPLKSEPGPGGIQYINWRDMSYCVLCKDTQEGEQDA